MQIKNRFSGQIILEIETTYKANLRGANLWEIDLRETDLREADLRRANLREAELGGAHLGGADLRGANLDLSCFPLWCGSFGMIIDDRFIWQLIAHIGRLDIRRLSKEAKEAIKHLEPYFDKFCDYRDDVKKIFED